MKKNLNSQAVLAAVIIGAGVAYALFYFNYFETPSGDYIGNVLPPVQEYQTGKFPGTNFKFLPAFPVILALVAPRQIAGIHDPVYWTAMVLNMILLAPFLLAVFFLYRRFLGEKASLAALLILAVNMNTVYMTINAELEMVLALSVTASLALTMRDSPFSYATAFIAAATKWDSVFIIPAVMFRDFFYRKRRIIAIVLGCLATAGVGAWTILSVMHSMGRGNVYIDEIAHRGPNIYKYFLDCLLVTGGYIPWMATQGWNDARLPLKIFLIAGAVLSAIPVLVGIVWGAVLLVRRHARDAAPLMVFTGGFLAVHMIYQNTKSRYVLPILWLLTMLMVKGLAEGLIPWIKERLRKPKWPLASGLLALPWIASLAAIAAESSPGHLLFALVFTILAGAIFLDRTVRRKPAHAIALLLAAGLMANLTIYYGVQGLDHYSLHRVEFKKAALWYRDNARPGDRMLITEANVPMYYSGFGAHRFLMPFFLKGKTVREIHDELRREKVTLVFVDDFYIRRLAVNDPNAVDRRAWIFRTIRDEGAASGLFSPIERFDTRGGIKSIIFTVRP